MKFTKNQNDILFEAIMTALVLIVIFSIYSILQLPKEFRNGIYSQIMEFENQIKTEDKQFKDDVYGKLSICVPSCFKQ